MTMPGQAAVCFTCGQPIPSEASVATAATAKAPPNHYSAPPPSPAAVAQSFIIAGSEGTFKVSPGGDVLVGRDPARCAVHLVEPRVSAVHATMKVEGGSLWVRDEQSNNGVWINGERIATSTWAQVPANAALRFGPIQFSVQAG